MLDLWLLAKPRFTPDMQARIERLLIENNQINGLDKDIFEALIFDSIAYSKIYILKTIKLLRKK